MEKIEKKISKLDKLPFISHLSPSVQFSPNLDEEMGFLKAQKVAFKSALEVQLMIKEGWSEIQTAKLMEEILRDNGVKSFFHRPFVWFGENTRYVNVKKYSDFKPTQRRLSPNEVVILDVAPIFQNYTCDIGHSFCFGEDKDYDKALIFLNQLRTKIVTYFAESSNGEEVWTKVNADILKSGFDNIHALYPFSVLGHRLHQSAEGFGFINLLNFEWPSYWNLISRGIYGQILSPHHQGELVGLWAIEPHIGCKNFGIKFEEILVVHRSGAYWLKDKVNL